ncbi:helix-turn-helix transcriptional regulator [Hymenobacter sp. HSC-4F20]|uniref:helix-turn-helix domain-containing protein n=1 Tax=Hymenobacter sp. HSC-4F20 TaxID=2864135 RepID=UPI001C72A163|nr:helix-turn-helix transcriptional regulator [Hymenobacter sp. HSC-4F20]MBX0292613.1 helix-turn-helix transcriptional regulator [Hymenobacter sp. HSC-4F20]
MTAHPTPHLLLALRTRYGLSQAQLAEYLSVSRAQVSMAEQGRRVLPTTAWSKLLPLLHVLEAPATSAGTPTALDDASRTALQRRLRDCTHEATRLRQELAHMRAKASQCQAVLRELVPLLRPLATAGAARKEEAWLALREEEAQQEVARSGPAAQALLELRIDALDYEAGQAALRLARALG